MTIGYQGYGVVDGVTCLCTGSSISKTRNRLESGGTFSGSEYGTPRTYDWESYDGSIDFEANTSIVNKCISLIADKKGEISLSVYPYDSASSSISEAVWTSVSFTANEGAAVTGSIAATGLGGIQDGGNGLSSYISTRTGNPVLTSSALNPSQINTSPIPFWNTTVTGLDCLSWNVSWTQSATLINACTNTSSVQEPFAILLSPTTGNFTFEAIGYSSPDSVIFSLTVGGINFSISCELNSTSTNIAGQSDIVTTNADYQIFG